MTAYFQENNSYHIGENCYGSEQKEKRSELSPEALDYIHASVNYSFLKYTEYLTILKETYQKQLKGFPGGSVVKHLPTMRETWVQSLSQEDPLEKAMAPHSSTLAWKIPWTEKPGRLQSTGSQRVRHD